MTADVAAYTGLITSEHADKPNFVATVSASVQPFADILAMLNGMPAAFDIDSAVGAQLDIVGQWVGVTRYVRSPLTGVYFGFDSNDVGWDRGVWFSDGEPLTGLARLPDDIYLLLLKAKIAANQWDGTVPGAYAAWDALFAPYGFQILIQDHGDMTMTLALGGISNSPAFLELFVGGYLDLRPASVMIDGYIIPSANAPFFGFDAENSGVSGWDVGSWGIAVPTNTTVLIFDGTTLYLNGSVIRLDTVF